MPRIYLPLPEPSEKIQIVGEKARYLSTVLRCKEGDILEIFDGNGKTYVTKVLSVTKREVIAGVTEIVQSASESPLNIILIQGLLRGEKMDLVIQKTTELGVKEIIPVITGRSQLRETRKTSRWRKIAEDAARQSGRTSVPVIREVIPFPAFLSEDSIYRSNFNDHRGLIFWEEGGTNLTEIQATLKGCMSIMLAIGPEGGFAGEEVQNAEARGFLVASLGKRILRAETAAIIATALMQFTLGGLD
jgi:16S rRNA (uracil1498-N3)-methyltransferase